jgi:hypothetical protein
LSTSSTASNGFVLRFWYYFLYFHLIWLLRLMWWI